MLPSKLASVITTSTSDPPNAVLTWVDADGVSEVEVVITDANFEGNNVIYTIENTTITANQSFEDVSLFVDGNGSSNNVYLASNGVTIKASAGAESGDTGVLNGITYTVVDQYQLAYEIKQNSTEIHRLATTLVTYMSCVFCNNSNFNQDISSWDVSNVTSMYSMFESATAFNQDISSWDVSKVNDMEFMFRFATAFNQDLSSWDVSNVTTCDSFSDDAPQWTLPQPNFTNCTP